MQHIIEHQSLSAFLLLPLFNLIIALFFTLHLKGADLEFSTSYHCFVGNNILFGLSIIDSFDKLHL